MDYSVLNPYARFAVRTLRGASYPAKVYAYDHRLFFAFDNHCEVRPEGAVYALTRFSLLILPPKTGYRLLFAPQTACCFALLNFDMDAQCYGKPSRPPVPLDRFNDEALFSPLRLAPFDRPFFLQSAPALQERLSDICALMEHKEPFFADRISAELKAVLLCALVFQDKGRLTQAPMLAEVKAYVDEHFTAAGSNAAIAARFGYHPYYLNRLFTAAYGQTLHAYVISVKLRHARRLLLSTSESIAAIARASGFQGAAWFSECFRADAGISPSEYRRQSL